jgi:hypothetical protein
MAAVRNVSLALDMVAVSNDPLKVGMRCLVGRWIMSGRSQWPRGLKAWVCGRTLAGIVGWRYFSFCRLYWWTVCWRYFSFCRLCWWTVCWRYFSFCRLCWWTVCWRYFSVDCADGLSVDVTFLSVDCWWTVCWRYFSFCRLCWLTVDVTFFLLTVLVDCKSCCWFTVQWIFLWK